ncbi:NUP155 [Auxenochlorella protothecoides x Auxenochlorella symbiontica]
MQAQHPPPVAWASDGLPDGSPGPSQRYASTSADEAGDVGAVASAWKHVKAVSSRDEGRSSDLWDLLSHSLRETQYSPAPPEWPAALRHTTSTMSEMPAAVLDRFAACQTVAFCGVFPELRRAWASVDSSLFLWRFDRWQDVPMEYSGEDQSIVAVGLAPARPGVFVSAIQHVLVVCTTTEILLVGACCGRSPGGTGDEWDQLTLAPLPLFSVPSDGVTTVTVTCTAGGRIFLGGADGNLYELQYQSSSGVAGRWRGGRPLTKVCHTAGVRSYLPSFLPSFLVPPPSPLLEALVDEERHILYTRDAASRLAVYDLGPDGRAAPARAAVCSDFAADALRASGGRETFGRGGGGGGAPGAAPASATTGVAAMAVVPRAESSRLALLTVTGEGHRVYWSVSAAQWGSGTAGAATRPDRLRAEFARPAPPAPRASRRDPGAVPGIRTQGERVAAACAAEGVLLLAEAAPQGGSARLVGLARDVTLPPLATATGASLTGHGLRETVAELPGRVPGDACAIRHLAGPPPDGPRPPHPHPATAPSTRFALVTTAGVALVERRGPLDTLAALFEEGASGPRLDSFFAAHGAAEAAAMCVALAALGETGPAFPTGGAGPGSAPSPGTNVRVLPAVRARARAALADPRLCGAAARGSNAVGAPEGFPGPGGNWPASAGAGAAAASNGVPSTGPGFPTPQQQQQQQQFVDAPPAPSFDMGAPVPVAEQDWSAAHRGLCLAAARALHAGLWDEPLFQARAGLLRCTLGPDALSWQEARLARLAELAGELRAPGARPRPGGAGASVASAAQASLPTARLRAADTGAAREAARAAGVAALLSRAAQACFLLRTLGEHNLGRLVARAPDLRADLEGLKFRELVAGEGGDAAAAALVACLVGERLDGGGGEELTAALRAGCPAFFREDDRVYYRALGALARAEAAETVADREAALGAAVESLAAVPAAVDLAALAPRLARLRAFRALVGLAAGRARLLTGGDGVALGNGAAGGMQPSAADAAYEPVVEIARVLLAPDPERAKGTRWEGLVASIAPREAPELRRALLDAAVATRDPGLLDALYSCLVDAGAVGELIAADAPGLETHLIRGGGLAGVAHASQIRGLEPGQVARVVALARFYTARREYAKAAQAYEVLADVPVTGPRQELTLEQRAEYLALATLQARSCGEAVLLDQLTAKARVLAAQRRILEMLTRDEEGGADAETLAALEAGPRPLAELYNDIAVPRQLWSSCLEMIGISAYGDAAYVSQLWDLSLKSAWERGWAMAAPDSEADDPAHAAAEALEEVAREVEFVAQSVGAPDENSLPLPHVTLRLEQVAAGLWPVETGLPLPAGRVGRAVSVAAGSDREGALRAYETLLSTAGVDAGDESAAPSLRARLVESALLLLQAAAEQLPGTAPRERAALAGSCDALLGYARRLQDSAAAARLVPELEAAAAALHSRTSGRGLALLGGF